MSIIPPVPAPFHEPLVFVDLETTGANPVRDRITEIGIVEVTPEGVQEWSTLVNPGQPIPPFIQQLTGIDDAMVAGAPAFADLAQEVLERLKGRLFIAHNARFDYGFLKNEFRRLGLKFHSQVLCTVKLSRKIQPQYHRHSLDALIERHGLFDENRHRALSDARLIHQFWGRLHEQFPAEHIWTTVDGLTLRPVLPPQLPPEAVDDLPELPGVYVFRGLGEAGPEVLYVGKSTNLRQRVFAHFAAEPKDARERDLAQRVERVEWHETVGELGALLLETKLLRELQPSSHRASRQGGELCSWRLVQHNEVDWRPELVLASELDFAGRDDLFGLFNSQKEARNTLRKLAEVHHLCQVVLGLEKARPGKSCFAHQSHNCKGVCIGREPLGIHSARLMAALAKLKLKEWNYPGPIALVEKDDFSGTDLHLVDRWCYLGTAQSEAGLWELLDSAPTRPVFNADIYRQLNKAITQGKVEVQPLGQRPA